MHHLRLSACVLALACSEYGFRADQPYSGGGDLPQDPSGGTPDAPGDDTGAGGRDIEPDCEAGQPGVRHLPWPEEIAAQELHIWSGPTDFDGFGVMLASYPQEPYGTPDDLFGIDMFGSSHLVAQDVERPMIWHPRVLPDGNLVYASATIYHETTGFVVLDGVDGSQVDFVPLGQRGAFQTIEPDSEGWLYVGGAFHDRGKWTIARYHPYTGASRIVAEGPAYFHNAWQHVRDLALSPDGESVYASMMFTDGAVLRAEILEFPRLGPDSWGEPVTIWSVPSWAAAALAVDACDNVYFAHHQDIWRIPHPSGPAEHVLTLPGFNVRYLFWGSGVDFSRDDALYAMAESGAVGDITLRVTEIDLDVDGTHVLAR